MEIIVLIILNMLILVKEKILANAAAANWNLKGTRFCCCCFLVCGHLPSILNDVKMIFNEMLLLIYDVSQTRLPDK